MNESQSQTLCKAYGLCCNGHLFAWVRLNANELDKVPADPRQRGFLQPCPVWQGGYNVTELIACHSTFSPKDRAD